ncbi:hypothetical protein EDEG_00151 [Edhazardia aedis USNM 41457]|uniref:Uncharacterized protein n=1 Tax=Edhazardia aedis (strain USNM 41457) TaxID=1003232 RepID=J9DNW3_EDHAE|nr:hypothetical protein EDEG_00151 [Edhazardia aedis USNM 41457]|eukprot:EJW04235.1 hypothetical protein EDEG_00151 [Edhazardia aedis USNM 41457]
MLRPYPESPYDHKNNRYSLIDHKLASVRYYLIKNNESSLVSLYKLMLKLVHIVNYNINVSVDGAGRFKSTKYYLISKTDLVLNFYTNVATGAFESIDFSHLISQILHIQSGTQSLTHFKNLFNLYENDNNYSIIIDIIRTICMANTLTHRLCCVFEPKF